MTWFATGAAIVSAVVGVGTAIYSADVQRKQAHAAQDQAEADAEAAAGAARVEAAKIRKQTRDAQSSAVAALAASGVDVTQGTAEQIQTDIYQRGEEDAITTILTGQNRGRLLAREGELYGIQARNASTAGSLNALSSVASSARGWRGTSANNAQYDSIAALGRRTTGTGD